MSGSLRMVLAALPLLVAPLAGCSSDMSSSTPSSSTTTSSTTSSTVTPMQPQAPVASSGTTAAGPQPMRLDPADIQQTLVNNTVTGIAANGQTYYAWFGPTGQIRFAEGNIRDTGTWRTLPDGQLCSKMSRLHNGTEECYTLFRSGNVMTFDRDGAPVGSFTVLQGNPQDL